MSELMLLYKGSKSRIGNIYGIFCEEKTAQISRIPLIR